MYNSIAIDVCVFVKEKNRENLHSESMEEDNNNGESLTVVNGGDFKAENNVSEEEEVVVVESMVTWLFAMDNDDDGGDATELSKVLEASAEKTYEMKVKIIDNPPCWHPLIFQTAASYITINGNEESCGSSFSDSDTSYMAGISGGGWGLVVADGGAWDGVVEEEARGWIESEDDRSCLVNGGSIGGYCDDDMLAKFLGDGFEQTP